MIKDETWNKMYEYLYGFKRTKEIYIKSEEDCRKFIEAIFWIVRSGSRRRLLPKEYGKMAYSIFTLYYPV